MVKKLIVIIIFILSIVGLGFFESHYILSSFDELSDKLVVIEQSLAQTPDQIDSEENVNSLKQLHTHWQKHTQM